MKAKAVSKCDISRGGSPRPIADFLGGTIPWIKIGDATDGDEFFITKTKEHIIAEGLSKTRLISKGSVVFANCGVSLGFARILKIDGCIHDGWLAFMDINEKLKITVIVITHQMSVVESICNRVAILENGVVVEQGLVSDIFARPKSEAAKRLVFPELAQMEAENSVIEDTAAELPAVPLSNAKNIIRVVFNGTNTANQPLVAELAIQKRIKANIAHASTKSIGDTAYGTMLLSFETPEDKNEAIKFLTETGHVLAEDF